MPDESHPISKISLSSGCGPLLASPGAENKPLRQQVFERVRSAGQLPRVDVAKALGISPGSVTAATSELISEGWIFEFEGTTRDNVRGRPPVALGVRAEAGYVIGMKLSDELHSAVVLDFSGRELTQTAISSAALKTDLSAILNETKTLFDGALEKAELCKSDLRAVGLGLPGTVDHVTGHVPWSPILRERGACLKDALSERLGVPVYIDNDANVLTLAELWFGAGRAMSDFAVVTIEHGVGMGLVLNNRLFRGSMGMGTELGHIKVQLDGALCRCGQRGCLEAYVADYALVREASTALDWNRKNAETPQLMLESLYDQAKAGNLAARSIFRRAGRFLSVGLANVVNLFDPNLIILSGERMRFDYLYAEEVLAEMRALVLDTGRDPPRVDINAWGGPVWARGAAALALSQVTDKLFGADRTGT